MNKKFSLSLVILILLSFGFIATFYGSILKNPNKQFLKDNNDGLKNYFTYAFYIKQDKSDANFEGMNYPYGESVLYTDGHPLLAYSLKLLSNIFPGIESYSIGILNSLLLASLILTSIFLFLLFCQLKIDYSLAVLSAFSIMVLSPQIFRFGGHYALAYMCFIPINLYLLMLFEKEKSNGIILILITLVNIVGLFTHAYLGMIVTGFTLAYLIVKIIYEFKNWGKYFKQYLGLFASVIVPIIIFILFLKFSDAHIGRTTNAGNLLKHSVSLYTVFLSYFHPSYPFFKDLFSIQEYHWEDISFIGFAGDIVVITVIILFLISLVKRKLILFKNLVFGNKFLTIALPASILLLIFSMDYPFKWGMEDLLELKMFELIKNFRANGRFAWSFYFVFSIWAVYMVNKLQLFLREKNLKYLAIALIIIYPTSLFVDGYYYHDIVSKQVNDNPNLFRADQLDKELRIAINNIPEDKYQAIIPLPYFHTGSGNFRNKSKPEIFQLALVSSYHTEIPLMASRLTRVSIDESKKLIQLMSNPFYPKEIENDINDERPFLVIKSIEKLSISEIDFLSRCTLVYQGQEFSFYEISKPSLFKSSAKEEEEIYASLKSELVFKDGFYVTDSTSYFYYLDYEDSLSSKRYRGNGAFTVSVKKPYILANIPGKELELGEEYIASVWVYNCGENFGQDQLTGLLKMYFKENGKSGWEKIGLVGSRSSQIINGCWSMVQIPFTVNNREGDYILRLEWQAKLDRNFYLDDLLIFNPKNRIYRMDEKENTLFLNNHKIPL